MNASASRLPPLTARFANGISSPNVVCRREFATIWKGLNFKQRKLMQKGTDQKKKTDLVKYDERIKRREQLLFQTRDAPLAPGMRKKHVENMMKLHLPTKFLGEQEEKKEVTKQEFHREGLEIMRQWVPGEDMHIVERRKKIHKQVHYALKKRSWVQFDQLVQQLSKDQIPFDEITFNMISLGYLVSPSHGDDMALAMLQEMRACRFVHPSFVRLIEGVVLSHFEIKAVCGQGFSKKFLRKAIKTGWEVGLHFKRKRLANVRRYIRDHLARGEDPDLNPDILAMLTTLDHKQTQKILQQQNVVNLLEQNIDWETAMSSGGFALPGSGGQGPGERWEEVHDEHELPQACQGHIMPPEVLEKHRLYRLGVAGPDKNFEQQMMNDIDDSDEEDDDDDESEDEAEGDKKAPINLKEEGTPTRRPSAKIM